MNSLVYNREEHFTTQIADCVVSDASMRPSSEPSPQGQAWPSGLKREISVEGAALAATNFIHQLSGFPTAMGANSMAASAVCQQSAQIVPTSSVPAPLPGIIKPEQAQAPTLTPSQLGELELARQRAARAAAGRRQQLIQQKRAKEAARESKAAQQTTRASKRQASARVAQVTQAVAVLHSEDGGDDSEEEDEPAGNDTAQDHRKLKRLLRNRISAQQARERKKQHLATLEDQLKAAQDRATAMETALRTAEAQNEALRRIIRNMNLPVDYVMPAAPVPIPTSAPAAAAAPAAPAVAAAAVAAPAGNISAPSGSSAPGKITAAAMAGGVAAKAAEVVAVGGTSADAAVARTSGAGAAAPARPMLLQPLGTETAFPGTRVLGGAGAQGASSTIGLAGLGRFPSPQGSLQLGVLSELDLPDSSCGFGTVAGAGPAAQVDTDMQGEGSGTSGYPRQLRSNAAGTGTGHAGSSVAGQQGRHSTAAGETGGPGSSSGDMDGVMGESASPPVTRVGTSVAAGADAIMSSDALHGQHQQLPDPFLAGQRLASLGVMGLVSAGSMDLGHGASLDLGLLDDEDEDGLVVPQAPPLTYPPGGYLTSDTQQSSGGQGLRLQPLR